MNPPVNERTRIMTKNIIPLKMTWAAMLPYLIAVIEDSENPESKQAAKEDLLRMAKIADSVIAEGK